MKIVFLDFDGVLNTSNYQRKLQANGECGWDDYGHLFDPDAIRNLKRIIDAVPDVRIVVSSSWKAEGLDQLRLMWIERGLPGNIHDVTPDFFNKQLLTIDLSDPTNIRKAEGIGKGKEISVWIKRYGGQDCQYVILDDMAEFKEDMAEHHIHINTDVGITLNDADRVIKFLTQKTWG